MIENTKEARLLEHLADNVDAVRDAAALLAAMANPKRLHVATPLQGGDVREGLDQGGAIEPIFRVTASHQAARRWFRRNSS